MGDGFEFPGGYLMEVGITLGEGMSMFSSPQSL